MEYKNTFWVRRTIRECLIKTMSYPLYIIYRHLSAYCNFNSSNNTTQ